MYSPRHAGSRSRKPLVAVLGVVALAAAAAATILTAAAPAHAATPAPTAAAPSFSVGAEPIDLAVATYAGRAYVATDSDVVVVDTSAHETLKTVPTGLQDQTAIGLVQAGAKAYVGSFSGARMAVLDTASQTVARTVRVGTGTTAIANVVTPRAEYAYLAQAGDQHSRITVVSAGTDEVVDHIHVPGGPQSVAATPDQSRMWVGTQRNGRVRVINPRTRTVVRTISTVRGGPVTSIAFNATGTRAYLSGLGGLSAVNVANGRTRWFLPSPRLFPGPTAINMGPVAVGPRNTLMVTNSTFPDDPQAGRVTVLNRSTHRVLGRTRLGLEPTGLAIDLMGRQALFTNYADGTVSYLALPR